jgi:hypothetical protein
MQCCGICYSKEEGGPWVSGAPCGFVGPHFHLACILKLQNAQGVGNWRCPHCNVPLDEMAWMGRLVAAWMQAEGTWSEKARFFALGKGLQREETSQLALVVGVLIDAMKKNMHASACVQVWNNKEEKYFFSCGMDNCLLVITLCRTAYYGNLGCILWDGYGLSATRSRRSARLLCAC